MILDLIRAEKDNRNLTNDQLSKLSGVPVGTINRVLSGKTASPNYITVVALCRALDISIDEVEGIKSQQIIGDPPKEKPTIIVQMHQTNYQLRAENELLKEFLQYVAIALFGLVTAVITIAIELVRR